VRYHQVSSLADIICTNGRKCSTGYDRRHAIIVASCKRKTILSPMALRTVLQLKTLRADFILSCTKQLLTVPFEGRRQWLSIALRCYPKNR
jgi:hypothetical protein